MSSEIPNEKQKKGRRERRKPERDTDLTNSWGPPHPGTGSSPGTRTRQGKERKKRKKARR